MLNITTAEAEAILTEAHERGWTRLTLDDVFGAAQYSDTERDLWGYLREYDDDMRIEQECDDKAAAWFEVASYGYPDED